MKRVPKGGSQRSRAAQKQAWERSSKARMTRALGGSKLKNAPASKAKSSSAKPGTSLAGGRARTTGKNYSKSKMNVSFGRTGYIGGLDD